MTNQKDLERKAMEASLRETQEVKSQVDSVTRRFAAGPEGPLDGSIHPAFQRSSALPITSNTEPGVVDIVAPGVPVHDKRLVNLYVHLTSSLISWVDSRYSLVIRG